MSEKPWSGRIQHIGPYHLTDDCPRCAIEALESAYLALSAEHEALKQRVESVVGEMMRARVTMTNNNAGWRLMAGAWAARLTGAKP